jgi:4-hydroxy-2-oxoheptanedioate aldolase
MPFFQRLPRARSLRSAALLGGIFLITACAGADEVDPPADAEPATQADGSDLVELLREGEPVFGVFSGPKTPEQGATMASETDADFILYSMESGPFDVAEMEAYLNGMKEAGGESALHRLPVVLRVPPIDDVEAARAQLEAALPTGIGGIVFPHVARPDQAATSAALLPDSWPQDPAGDRVNILIVEDHEGIENVRDIMATPGLSVVFAGPGDLRRAYEGDMEKVESAIQAVLAACKEFDVVCGVTAGVEDIGERLDQGFGMIIVTEPEAVAVGKAAAGRIG